MTWWTGLIFLYIYKITSTTVFLRLYFLCCGVTNQWQLERWSKGYVCVGPCPGDAVGVGLTTVVCDQGTAVPWMTSSAPKDENWSPPPGTHWECWRYRAWTWRTAPPTVLSPWTAGTWTGPHQDPTGNQFWSLSWSILLLLSSKTYPRIMFWMIIIIWEPLLSPPGGWCYLCSSLRLQLLWSFWSFFC